MQSDRIFEKYKEAFKQLEEYDKTRELAVGRKRIDVTLDKKVIIALKDISRIKHKAMSRIIEEALNLYVKKVV